MDLFALDIIAILAAVAFVAGFIDAIAGGGGLLTVPALLAAGLTPAQALATNKLQGSFGSLAAALHFIRQGYVTLREMRLAIGCTFAGAAAGAVAVQVLPPAVLARVVPLLLLLATLYFMFSPRVSDVHGVRRISEGGFALLLGTSIRFYDGFFGPGTGSFFVLACIALLGLSARAATARTKVLNLTSNFAALLFFIAGGQVMWSVGLPMALGQVIGGRLGAGVVIGSGARIVKPMLVLVSLLLTLQVVLEYSSRRGLG